MHLIPNLHSFDRITSWRGRLPAVTEVVLVSLLALQVARLAWLVLTPAGPLGTAAPAAAVAHPDPAALPLVDVFFRSTAAPATGNHEAFGYSLFGVRRDGDGGSAILGKDGDQASYAVGGDVTPGIVLESIGRDHAVLAANGARHRLDLPRLAMDGGRSTPRSRPVGAPQSRPAVLPMGAPGPEPATPPTATATASTVASTTHTLPEQASAPTGLAAQPDGGYAITAGAEASLLRPAGLRPGDVLLSINGRPLDPARLAGLQNELKGGNPLTIQYRRDGKTHTTTLQPPR